MSVTFKFTGKKKVLLAGILFHPGKPIEVTNGSTVQALRNRKDFEEVKPKEEKQDSEARSPKGDAKQS